ncbi:MAG: polysaccharide deacetylase family protein [Bacteroidales bacterium]|nr:polysaccharide deacetylase family protein [Bacteroidales bacterium]
MSLEITDGITISIAKLEEQFQYLSVKGYTCLTLSHVINHKDEKLPPRVFVLTFDDAYLNNFEYLYPLLQKYNFHATIMLPVGYLGKTNVWDKGEEPIMDFEKLQALDNRYISFGLHTFRHISLKDSTFEEIVDDISKCKETLSQHGIEYLPVLAYPFGAYPRDRERKAAFFNLMNKLGIVYGLRIGNKINKWPLKHRFEVKRIDIRGDEPFWKFKTKLKKGRVKMF